MRIVVFVRHGESEANVRGIISSDPEKYGLTKRGVRQAEIAAEELSCLREVGELYSSPVLRALQTAKVISERMGKRLKVDKRLAERSFGSLEGRAMPPDNRWKLERNTGIYEWSKLRKDMYGFIRSLKSGTTVAVTHGDNMAAVCDLADRMGEQVHALKCPANCSFVVIDAESMTLIANGDYKIPQGAFG